MTIRQTRMVWAYGLADGKEWGLQAMVPMEADKFAVMVAERQVMQRLLAEVPHLTDRMTGVRIVDYDDEYRPDEDDD